jgi:uncharacterized repeat protein (TIGR03803 family)
MIFKLTPAGAFTTFYSFCAEPNCTDGAFPPSPVIQATDGNLYGTTGYGGTNNLGTVYQITPSGTLTSLHDFNGTDGAVPGYNSNQLFQATNGIFYGGTSFDGANGNGTMFALSVGLAPFVQTVPTFGKVGDTIQVLGTDLTGASSVSFNGTAAVFAVVSKTLISATVPAGAATGKVEVVTPVRTLKSNVRFRVLP